MHMIRRGKGKIVNMASVSGVKGMVGQANYGASKAAVISLTQTLSKECARFNINVNALAPGFIKTEMVTKIDERMFAEMKKAIPFKRAGTTEEVSYATLFLLSNFSDYITGQAIVIDGGLSV